MNLDIQAEDVLMWESKKLWNLLKALSQDPEHKVPSKDLEKIKNGFRITVPIWYFTEEWFEIYPASKKVKIVGHGKYNLDDFMKEKEDRDALMRSTIISVLDDGGIVEGRTE